MDNKQCIREGQSKLQNLQGPGQNKMGGPLFKEQRKGAVNGTKKYKAFPFFCDLSLDLLRWFWFYFGVFFAI